MWRQKKYKKMQEVEKEEKMQKEESMEKMPKNLWKMRWFRYPNQWTYSIYHLSENEFENKWIPNIFVFFKTFPVSHALWVE